LLTTALATYVVGRKPPLRGLYKQGVSKSRFNSLQTLKEAHLASGIAFHTSTKIWL